MQPGHSFPEGSFDEFGYATLSGRNPQYKNEIAIGVNVARTFNKDVGDTMVVYIQGQRNRYLVTGIYQAIANMSNSARLTGDTPFSASNALPLTSEGSLDYMIRLKDNAQATAVANELNAEFQDTATVVPQQALIDSVYNEAALILLIPMVSSGFCSFFSHSSSSIARTAFIFATTVQRPKPEPYLADGIVDMLQASGLSNLLGGRFFPLQCHGTMSNEPALGHHIKK